MDLDWGILYAEAHVERRLRAILAADVAGYSRLMGVNEESTLAETKARLLAKLPAADNLVPRRLG